MRAIKLAVPDSQIPVPKVYGWRKYREWLFIYMSLIPGATLQEAWPSLIEAEKRTICKKLTTS